VSGGEGRLRVCLIANQISAWGKIGGFGTATRALGGALAGRGVEVTAVVPRRAAHGQPRRERLDGIDVHAESSWSTFRGGAVFAALGADVYHSQEPTVASRWAQRAAPHALHVVTCRDPRSWRDHLVELRHATWRRRAMFPFTWAYEIGPWVKRAVRRADAVLCPARCLRGKVRRLYGVSATFLPSPVAVPAREPRKSPTPLVLFVGRWDPRKRIERFFALAERFPEVRFAAIGRAHEPQYDRRLRRLGGRIGNLEMPGEASPFAAEPGERGALAGWYERAWVLVNTSAREGLPYTFLEAAAHGVALLSGHDPDGVTHRFGEVVAGDDYEGALARLLADGAWRSRGRQGARWVAERFAAERSVDLHLELYRRLLAQRADDHRRGARRKGLA
jgi:glycosyltransferase involved in cell wall biosynthesis